MNEPSLGRAACALLTALLTALLAAAAAVGGGCGSGRASGPYAPASDAQRDPARAQRLTTEAAACIDADPDKAERLLREALGADLYHGPAHNNLGVVLLRRGDLYGAASEFEWARKLMPGQPDPRLNLALALERAGRVEEAMTAAQAALDAAPEHVPSLVALTSLQLRHNRPGEHTAHMLAQIASSTDREDWREWAVRQRIALEARQP
jgi:tetratricopeptide (TPR) repeat protein